MKKIITLTFSVIGLILILLYMLGIIGTEKIPPGTTPLSTTPLDKNTQTAQVQRQMLNDSFSWPGTVKSRSEINIAPRITARILDIKVKAGDKVRKDDVIALLDPEAQRSHERSAQAALSAAQANAKRAAADAQRIKNLYAKEAATKETYDHVIAQYQVAQAQVDAAASALKETKISYADTILKAPFDGTVVQRLKQPGDMGLAGAPIVAMHNSAALRLEAAVPTSCARHIHLGEQVPVKIETLEQHFTAEIDEIVPEVDPQTRTILIKASLPIMAGLQPGLFGWLDQTCNQHQGLVVPATAVRKIGQLEVVKIVVNNQIQTRQVRIGKHYGSKVEIQSGLNEGETVIIQ
ncbi:MAG: efflux RND transporter periplasmic adaptor subunit [Methylococcaceae bacterium]|nr:efflux RND transporter periplasmic adaptor subunit [Methylococcaceae bacterium]